MPQAGASLASVSGGLWRAYEERDSAVLLVLGDCFLFFFDFLFFVFLIFCVIDDEGK